MKLFLGPLGNIVAKAEVFPSSEPWMRLSVSGNDYALPLKFEFGRYVVEPHKYLEFQDFVGLTAQEVFDKLEQKAQSL